MCPTPGNGDWLGIDVLGHLLDRQQREQPRSGRRHQSLDRRVDPGPQPSGGQSNTVKIADTELGIAGSTYYYCAHYVFPSWTQTSLGTSCTSGGSPIPQPVGPTPPAALGFLCEPDANRTNNFASRQMTVTLNPTTGSASFSSSGTQLDGTVLQRWPGATISSNTNGDPNSGPSDGRVYVAVKVTTLPNGKYHYEYALHNRDNKGGVGVFRIPSCSSAIVSEPGLPRRRRSRQRGERLDLRQRGHRAHLDRSGRQLAPLESAVQLLVRQRCRAGFGQRHARPGRRSSAA